MKSLLPSFPVSGATPMNGPDLSRRGFLQLGAGGLVASWFLKSPAAAWAAESAAVTTRRTRAKNVIFVFLPGAPSQVDTWDLKEGAWTPADFAPASFGGGLRFPAGLLPNIGEPPRRRLDRAVDEVVGARPRARADVGPDLAQPDGRDGLGGARTWAPSRRSSSRSSAARTTSSRRSSRSTRRPASRARATSRPRTRRSSCSRRRRGSPSLTHPDGATRLGTRWNDLAAARRGAPLRPAARQGRVRRRELLQPGQGADRHARTSTTSSSTRRRTRSATASSSFGNGCLVAEAAPRGRPRRALRHGVRRRLGHAQQHLRQDRHEPLQPDGPARPGAREPDRRPQGRARQDGGQDALRRDARRRGGGVRPDGRERSTARRAATTSRTTAPSSRAAASRAGRSSARRTRRARRSRTRASRAGPSSGPRTSRARSTRRSGSTGRRCATTTRSAAASSTCRTRPRAFTRRSTACLADGRVPRVP